MERPRLASPGNMKFGLGYMYGSDPDPNRLAAAAACFSAADRELDPDRALDPLFSRPLFSLEDFSEDREDDLSVEESFDFFPSPSDTGKEGMSPDPNPGRLKPENPRRGLERFMFASPPNGNPNGFKLLELDPVVVVDEDVLVDPVPTDAAAWSINIFMDGDRDARRLGLNPLIAFIEEGNPNPLLSEDRSDFEDPRS